MMDLSLGPIFSSFMRNRTGALLVVFQVAIALAVLANSAWIWRDTGCRVTERPFR